MLGPVFCGQIALAPLLPKLRGYFAEFLNNASPVGLGLLDLSTCVGLRYGSVCIYSGFSRRPFRTLRYSFSLRITASRSSGGFASLTGSPLAPASHRRIRLSHRVPTVLYYRSTGISTCPPSPTRLRLGLGPGLPGEDQLYPGNLGYSAGRILTFLSLLIPAFSLHGSPLLLSVQLLRSINAPLPVEQGRPRSIPWLRCDVSAPCIFGAGPLD